MQEKELDEQPTQPMGQRFIDLALPGNNAAWRYIVSLALIGFFWLVLGGIPYAVLVLAGGMLGNTPTEVDAATGVVWGLDPLWSYVAINLSLVMLLVGVCIVAPLMHGRSVRTLITTRRRISWRRFLQGFGLFFLLAGVDALVEWQLRPSDFAANFDPTRFLVLLPLAIIFTPLQVAAEELMFRGYLIQMLGRVLRNPVAAVVVSAVLFAVPHFLNPEMESGAVAMALNYVIMGLFMGLLVLRDNRIELAVGVHAGSNFFLAVFMTYPDAALTTPALFTTTRFDPVASLIAFCIMAVVFWVVQFHVIDRACPPPDDDEPPPEELLAGEAFEEPIVDAEWVHHPPMADYASEPSAEDRLQGTADNADERG